MKNNFFIVVLSLLILHGCKKIDYGVPAIKDAKLTLVTPVSVSVDGVLASCNSSLDLSAGNYTYGFCYSLTRNPVIPGLATGSKNYAAGNFSAVLANLVYGKTYYIRAFVTNGFATTYSTNLDSFAVPLYIRTDTVKNITARSFDISIYTLPAIKDSITERGVCYDTLAGPLVTNLKTISPVTDTGKITVQVNDDFLKAGKIYFLRSYCIANGNIFYGNEISFTTAGYKSGNGFIIFDKGDTTNGWRYIEAAPDSITRTNITWGCTGTDVPGALAAIGTGFDNTNAITTACPDTLTAAYVCSNLTLKSKTDWYLPSVEELKALYLLNISGIITRNVVLFSSSQASATDCFVVNFSTGQQQQIIKSSSSAVIWPVRRF